jgi:hypothetical protein
MVKRNRYSTDLWILSIKSVIWAHPHDGFLEDSIPIERREQNSPDAALMSMSIRQLLITEMVLAIVYRKDFPGNT